MTTKRFVYKSSDAWVLLAIVSAGRERGADLAGIVDAADYINHAILTYAELQNALFKLTADGLVREEESRFYPTATTLEFCDQPSKRKTRSVLVALDEIEEFLGAEPWSPGPEGFRQEFSYPGVTEQDFEAGVHAYLKRANAIVEKMFRSRKRKKKSP